MPRVQGEPRQGDHRVPAPGAEPWITRDDRGTAATLPMPLDSDIGDDKIAWYENDGSENFTAYIITTSAGAAISVYAKSLLVVVACFTCDPRLRHGS